MRSLGLGYGPDRTLWLDNLNPFRFETGELQSSLHAQLRNSFGQPKACGAFRNRQDHRELRTVRLPGKHVLAVMKGFEIIVLFTVQE